MEPGKHDLPRTCRYAAPLRTLANQFYAEYGEQKKTGEKSFTDKLKMAHTNLDALLTTYEHGGVPVPFVAEQTGEVSQDTRFEAALTFCTIDQLLAAALEIPYGVGQRETNLKVAGVLGSYLVFDEWHLYPQQARTVLLTLLRWLDKYGLGRFVLMTATLSTTLVEQLRELLNAEKETLREGPRVNESPDDAFRREYQAIASGRERTLQYLDSPLENHLPHILERHQAHGRTLIVCNRPQRAQAMYLALEEKRNRGDTDAQLLLLHSRFAHRDRNSIADQLDGLLGKEAWKRRESGEEGTPNLIVIATQVVEVGLNISAIDVHSKLAPASSLVQRAGRGARFPGERGSVTVYAAPPANTPRAQYLPYNQNVCVKTREALGDNYTTARSFDYAAEQELIDHVHTEEDKQFLDAFLRQEEEQYKRRIWDCWNWERRSGSEVSELIRDVRRVPILIHDNPEEAITVDPWRWQAFGLHPDSLRGRYDRLQELAARAGCDWAMKRAVLREPERDADNRSRTPCEWECVTQADQAASALFLVLPRALAHYDKTLGFALRDADLLPGIETREHTWQSGDTEHKKARKMHSATKRQSALTHISGLVGAYQWSIADELAWLVRRLERACDYPAATIDGAIRLAIAVHDLGKFTRAWQAWAIAFMEALHREQPACYDPPQKGVLWAKTNIAVYGSPEQEVHKKEEVALRSQGKVRPHHAVESVKLGGALINALLTQLVPDEAQRIPLYKVVNTAIAHHHTRAASDYTAAEVVDDVERDMGHLLRKAHWADHNLEAIMTEMLRPKGKACAIKEPGTASDRLLTFGADLDDCEIVDNPLPLWVYFTVVRALRLADKRADFFS